MTSTTSEASSSESTTTDAGVSTSAAPPHPSARPTISGSVSEIEMEKTVTEDLSDDEIADVVNDIKDKYGVDDEDVTVDVSYDVNGGIDVTIPEDVDQTELEKFLEEQLADILGVPESSVDVTIDPETGDVTYVVSNDSVDDATGVQDQLNDPATLEELQRRLDDAFPGTVVNDIEVNDDITADVDVTVDTTDATNDPDAAGDAITDSQSNNGWNVDTTGKLKKAFLFQVKNSFV